MNYTDKLKEELKFGETAEISLNDKLNTYFNCSLTQTPQKHIFDFINDEKKVIIEVKTRKNTKHKYNDTMVGYNKVLEAKKFLYIVLYLILQIYSHIIIMKLKIQVGLGLGGEMIEVEKNGNLNIIMFQ